MTMKTKTTTVRAVIPHYFAEASAPVREIGAGLAVVNLGGVWRAMCLHETDLRRSRRIFS